jgi:hypothetical protein
MRRPTMDGHLQFGQGHRAPKPQSAGPYTAAMEPDARRVGSRLPSDGNEAVRRQYLGTCALSMRFPQAVYRNHIW